MASAAEDDLDYESDPEDGKVSLKMRRREASDDEEDDEQGERRSPVRRIDSIISDSLSEGGAAEYDGEDSNEFHEDELLEEDEEYRDVEIETELKSLGVGLDGAGGANEAVEEEEKVDDGGVYVEDNQAGENGEKEKKESEPSAVPTAGAFYMHDDRFRESAGGGRHRRNLGGRNLWESKDDRRWGHDKFEEMTIQGRHYGEQRRASRGRNRGRRKIQGQERGYPRGNRHKMFNNDYQNNEPNDPNNAPKNLNNTPKGVRGRGPRRYQSDWNEVPQNKEHWKSVEGGGSHDTSAEVSERTSTVESHPISDKKQVFSRLNSASPPFYPSASSNNENSSTQNRDNKDTPLRRNQQSSITDKNFSISASNRMRGKNVADFIGINNLHIDEQAPRPPTHHTGKPLTSSQLQGLVHVGTNSSESPHSKVQGRVQTPTGKMTYQSTQQNQVYRVSNPSQHCNGPQVSALTRQISFQASGRQLGQGTQDSSSPDSAFTVNSFEFRETKSPPESSVSNTELIGKGKSVHSNGRGSFPYGGTQVVGASGNLGSTHGDVNFPGMPTFLPVMQFNGQHPGGMGVPAVGMAFPGYVGNPGSGNSEMTWLPILAGPAGALSASYNSPYISVDGSYHARPGQVPSLAGASSKESNINKPAIDLMPSQKHELASNELGQRQNKARRYTEMKFDQ